MSNRRPGANEHQGDVNLLHRPGKVIYRRTAFRLRKAEARAHILEGYKLALDNLDDFVRIIRASKNRDEAKTALMAKYPLSELQTNAILELRLYQLTGLERDKIEEEYRKLMALIEELRDILENEARLLDVIKEELGEMKEKYGNPRRSEIPSSTATSAWRISFPTKAA